VLNGKSGLVYVENCNWKKKVSLREGKALGLQAENLFSTGLSKLMYQLDRIHQGLQFALFR
jgi:hypothetical protein